jgi:hypothetical protein
MNRAGLNCYFTDVIYSLHDFFFLGKKKNE